MIKQYFEINEEMAKRAKEMNSFSDYVAGSATANYKRAVDSAYELAEREEKRKEKHAEEIEKLVASYSKKLADWYNEYYRIESMYVSIMISGGSNFDIRKKERQNNARERHAEKLEQIEKILDKIKTIGTGGISSSDSDAVEQLKTKIEHLTQEHERMKRINKYYRTSGGTLAGCPELSEEQANNIMADIERGYSWEKQPYPSYELTNNNAAIRRLKERLEQLEQVKEQGTSEQAIDDIDGLRVVENAELMRIQLIFDGKPDADTRNLLKHWGFKWAPSQGAWQRMLNNNGKYATKKVLEELKAVN